MLDKTIDLQRRGLFWAAHFSAMACPCELLIPTEFKARARDIAQLACAEVWRIEDKYNRFNPNSPLSKINADAGRPVQLDEETLALMQYAHDLYAISDGLFDISTGILRRLWRYHDKQGVPVLPQDQDIQECLSHIGLEKTTLREDTLLMPEGMELDFGGIGKEYAADKALAVVKNRYREPILINLGGDIVASDYPEGWQIGIGETRSASGAVTEHISLKGGAITTSGTSQRRWVFNGKIYSHILNPKTGWPVEDPPTSVTVVAPTCMQAGMLSTLIMLQGKSAETFAQQEQIRCWIHRDPPL